MKEFDTTDMVPFDNQISDSVLLWTSFAKLDHLSYYYHV